LKRIEFFEQACCQQQLSLARFVTKNPISNLPYKTGRAGMSNQVIERKPNGQFAKGSSGTLGGNAQRSRHALNADTIREMHLAFRRGGRKAIETVMRTQPAVFLKLLVLLGPVFS